MYEASFSADWVQLSRDEAVKRAYALGVAAACGHDNREEYEAVKASGEGAYDRSLIELSFDQGRSQALQLESSGDEPADIWEQLVESSTAERPTRKGGLPDALGPTELLERFDQLDGPPASVRKPSFLVRDDRDDA